MGIRSCLWRRTSIPSLRLCAAKAFGHRSKTTHGVVFIAAFESRLKSLVKQKREGKPLFLFYSGIGILNPVLRWSIPMFQVIKAQNERGWRLEGVLIVTYVEKQKRPQDVVFLFYSGIGIRTPTYRVRVCCATFTQYRYQCTALLSLCCVLPTGDIISQSFPVVNTFLKVFWNFFKKLIQLFWSFREQSILTAFPLAFAA